MTSEDRNKIFKRGFAKIIDEERYHISIGNVKLGRISKWVMKYVILSKDVNGIPSLIIYESQSDAENLQPKKIILIGEHTEARQTQPIDGEYFCLLIINSSKDSIIFACNFYGEIIDWQTRINEVVKDIKSTRERRKKLPPIPLPARSTEREKKDDPSYMMLEGYTNSEAKESNKEDTEDNEIYGGVYIVQRAESTPLIPPRGVTQEIAEALIYGDYDPYKYTVVIQKTETSKRLNLHGNYTLKLYDDGFQLLDKVTENVLYSWPVNVLSRYGCSNNRFSFESGRRSQTGVGNFIFLTPFCGVINKAVSNIANQHTKSLSTTDLPKTVAFHESKNSERENFDRGVPPGYRPLQFSRSFRNDTSTHFSAGLEGLREIGKQIKDMGNVENSKNLKIENDIYEGVHMYTVKIVENETAKRFELQGDYDLQLRDDTILLLNIKTNDILFSWPVEFLRRYDCSNNTFSFETGRRSETGVGRFAVSTIHCEIITQKVFEMCEHMKESKVKSDSNKSESTDYHERTDREEPRDDTTAEGPNIISPKKIWKNYPLHYFDTREHSPEPDQQTPRGIQYQQDSPVPSQELKEISNYPEWILQCPVQRDESSPNDILIFPKSETLYENINSKKF